MQLTELRERSARVLDEVERAVVGKRDALEIVLLAILCDGHVLLEDYPGLAKTLAARSFASATSLRFARIQFTPDLMPSDVTGSSIFDQSRAAFEFMAGPIFTNILLADEINRATPKTQSALLEVMEERCATVDGVTHRPDEPFQVLATMNPIDHQGTYALPAAQIDRFMVMLEIGYPLPDDEMRVLDVHLAPESPLAAVRPVVSRRSFVEWQRTVPHIHVTPAIKRAAVDYINALRRSVDDGLSISPRCTLA